MKIVYRGSFEPGATEEHMAVGLETLGHEVVRVQERDVGWAETVATCLVNGRADLFLWTSTQAFADRWPTDKAWDAIRILGDIVPTAAIHLDRFWDLEREKLIHTEPWFKLDYVFTADGDNDERWQDAGVRHRTILPSVCAAECFIGTPRDEFKCDIAFVGNYVGYHPEYPERERLVRWLQETYGDRFRVFPEPGTPNIYSPRLNDLFASVKVVVGDSIFAAQSSRCFSGRVFDTPGRGGFLIYPYIKAAVEALNENVMAYYHPQRRGTLRRQIDHFVQEDEERRSMMLRAQAHVLANHTYEKRMQWLVAVIEGGERGF